MANRFAFTVNTVQAQILGRAHNVDVRRFPLELPGLGHDPAHLVTLAGVVSQELDKQGLSRRGRLLPAAREAFALFADDRVSVAVTGIDGTDQHFAALGLSDGAQGMTVFQYAEQYVWEIDLMPDESWIPDLVALLPEQPAAPHRPLSVTTPATAASSAYATRQAAERAHEEDETAAFGGMRVQSVVRPPVNPFHRRGRSDAEMLADILSQPRFGSGRFLISARDRHGRNHVADPFGWLDTDDGRYLVHTHIEPDGSHTTSYASADHHDVADAIRTAIGTVYQPRRGTER
ncbi:ESX secretion-associated protein EspG [Amycolatopsis sp. NPDC059657]|uniref:ESX secretion-associated protein EspG n=1 Tax=Amycolatopsis sp. NPDC059657 TaxID=3346899 RepID=UPI00366D9C45